LLLLQLNQETIYHKQTGGAQPHIHPRDLFPLEIPVPEKSRQEEIATFLSDMEAEIVLLDQRLSKYRLLKQGMMQELLTGKTRLV
jgi:type I restriction enzyme S subunit